jgi:hypothetical protein
MALHEVPSLVWIDNVISISICLMAWTVGVLPVYIQARESLHMIRRVRAAGDLCFDVSQRLMVYDITGAKELIAFDLEDVDPKFSSSLRFMIGKLEQHLPNYVLDNDSFDSKGSNLLETSNSLCLSHGQSSLKGRVDESPEMANSAVFRPPSFGDDVVSVQERNRSLVIQRSVPERSLVMHRSVQDLVGSPNISRSEIVASTNITYGMFDIKAMLEPEDDYIDPFNAFVSRVHNVAALTVGSLHTFIGDTVHVTWNATGRRVHQHEVKAVWFMCWLRVDSGDSRVTLSGAVCTGPGLHHMAGGTRLVPLLHVEWRDRLRALYTLASEHGANVMCPDTHELAKMHVDTRMVDVLGYGENSTVAVHELLREEVSRVGEEWMYTVSESTKLD